MLKAYSTQLTKLTPTILNSNKTILWACYLAAAIVLMDLTSVNIALPTISEYYGIGMSKVSWLLMASMLSATSFAIIAGRIIDNYETSAILTLGFLIFIIGTLSSFFVDQFEILLAIRFFQGFGEALLYVVGPAYIRKNIQGDKQQSAYGIWMASTAVGISFGPVIGGFILSEFNWHGVFLINFSLSSIGILLLILNGSFMLRGLKRIKNADYWGAFYSFITLASVIFALNASNEEGFNDWIMIVAFSSFLVFLMFFIRRERRFNNPIFDFKLFRVRNFNLAAIGFFVFFMVNVGSRFLRPFYFENVKLVTPQISGLLMMVSPLVMLFVSPFSRLLSKYFQPKIVIITANVLLASSMFWFSLWDNHTAVWELILAMILLGLAMGLYYPVNSFVGMKDLLKHQSGMGSAAISASKSLGKLMGVLLFALCFSFVAASNGSEANIKQAYSYTFLLGSLIAIIGTVMSLNLNNSKMKD